MNINQDRDSFVCVPISTELYLSIASRYPKGVSNLIEDVLTDFLDRTEPDWVEDIEGVDWGKLFLPKGTFIRTKYKGEYKQALVNDSYIEWQGKIFTSVSVLANEMRNNTNNNAWKVLEIKRPIDFSWIAAENLR